MEIGEQHIDGFEAISRRDEKIGFAVVCMHDSVCICRGFDRPERSGADGHNPSAVCARGIDQIRGSTADVNPFAVHVMVCRIRRIHRQKRSRSDVKRHLFAANAFLGEPCQQVRREVQACGRRRR